MPDPIMMKREPRHITSTEPGTVIGGGEQTAMTRDGAARLAGRAVSVPE